MYPHSAGALLPDNFLPGESLPINHDSDSDGGWQPAAPRRGKNARDRIFRAWLRGDAKPEGMQYDHVVWTWPVAKRKQRVAQAVGITQREMADKVLSLWTELEASLEEKRGLETAATMTSVGARVRIVGCTTTGASKFQCAPASSALPIDVQTRSCSGCMMEMQPPCRAILASMNFTAVLIEEAAEISEPQLVAALPATAERLIMIGDHKQLPPKTNAFDLRVRRHCFLPRFLQRKEMITTPTLTSSERVPCCSRPASRQNESKG